MTIFEIVKDYRSAIDKGVHKSKFELTEHHLKSTIENLIRHVVYDVYKVDKIGYVNFFFQLKDRKVENGHRIIDWFTDKSGFKGTYEQFDNRSVEITVEAIPNSPVIKTVEWAIQQYSQRLNVNL